MSQSVEQLKSAPPFEGLTFQTIKSGSLGGRGDVTLYVAPQTAGKTDVPLVILLHGAFGSHWNWSVLGGAHRTAQRLIDAGVLPPLVVAMPSDGMWGDGTAYLKHRTQDFEKWIAEDVPNAVRMANDCLSAQSPVFIGGLSMGGFGAMRIGAKYPGLCKGISAHSSITHFDQLLKYVSDDPASFGTSPADHSVMESMLMYKSTLPPLRIDCGLTDRLLLGNRELHQRLKASGIAHEYHEFPGGHDWPYWTEHVEDSFQFFGEILKR